jgi:hypothetical protein
VEPPLLDPLPLDPPLLVPPPEPLAMLPLLVPPPDPLVVPLLVPLDPPLPEPPPSDQSPWLPPEDPHRVTTKARATRDVTRSIDCTFMNVRLPESSSRRWR